MKMVIGKQKKQLKKPNPIAKLLRHFKTAKVRPKKGRGSYDRKTARREENGHF